MPILHEGESTPEPGNAWYAGLRGHEALRNDPHAKAIVAVRVAAVLALAAALGAAALSGEKNPEESVPTIENHAK
ncbi:MAG: hypothetical protein AAB802_01640 [Patescibacteria group bacterium]